MNIIPFTNQISLKLIKKKFIVSHCEFFIFCNLAWKRFTVLASKWAFYEFDRKVRIKFYKAGKNDSC